MSPESREVKISWWSGWIDKIQILILQKNPSSTKILDEENH